MIDNRGGIIELASDLPIGEPGNQFTDVIILGGILRGTGPNTELGMSNVRLIDVQLENLEILTGITPSKAPRFAAPVRLESPFGVATSPWREK